MFLVLSIKTQLKILIMDILVENLKQDWHARAEECCIDCAIGFC
jgi:hypothetical protein